MLENKVVDIYTFSETDVVERNGLPELFSKYCELDGNNLLLLYFAEKVFFTWQSAISDGLLSNTLLEGRMFNKDAELHFWKVDCTTYGYRFRCESKEGKSNNASVYDDIQWLWDFEKGKNALVDSNKGIYIPFPIKAGCKSMRLTVRNYLREDKYGRLYFYDARFVDIKNDKNEVVYE